MSTTSASVLSLRWSPFVKGEPLRRIAFFEIAAAMMGLVWYLAFIMPPWELIPTSGSEDHLVLSIAFVLTSVATSTAFRSPILRLSAGWMPVLGTALMFVGAVLFGIVVALEYCIIAPSGMNSGTSSFLELAAFPILGIELAAILAYVTIPMGIASVFALRWVDKLARPRAADLE